MQTAASLPAWRRTAARLPLTLRPSVNQQLAEWEMLFPFEQKRLMTFLRGVDAFSASELDALTASLRSVEAKMGVAGWDFSESSNTLENSGQLARSQYYQEWRRAVQQVFAGIDARAQSIAAPEPERRRLIVIVLPDNLPVSAQTAWAQWKEQGREIPISGGAPLFCDLLVKGRPSLGEVLAQQGGEPSDVWLIDAEARPGKVVAPTAFPGASLSYSLLDPFRARFLSELNTIPRDTHVASQIMDTLWKKDWSHWWPEQLVGQDRLRHFVVELYLSGNGALIFSNAFVEWAASEVLRRARPRALVARFGLRNKPKPFTSIAIFENQTKVSAVPDTPDPESSALDAAILARYVWLSALRYAEYEQALCLCVAEHLNAALVVAPPGSDLANNHGPLSPAELHQAALRWLTS
jgi:hypothetical protein